MHRLQHRFVFGTEAKFRAKSRHGQTSHLHPRPGTRKKLRPTNHALSPARERWFPVCSPRKRCCPGRERIRFWNAIIRGSVKIGIGATTDFSGLTRALGEKAGTY